MTPCCSRAGILSQHFALNMSVKSKSEQHFAEFSIYSFMPGGKKTSMRHHDTQNMCA